jgi:group I intron endonuclease
MLGRAHSEESRKKMSDAKQGENHPRYGKSKAEGAGKSSQKIKVMDIIDNTTAYYNSLSETAKALNISSHKTIAQYISRKQQTPYKNRYVFIKID